MLTRGPNVFIVGGTGVGKTTLARKVALARGFTHVSASEWFRQNFDGDGITDKQAFTDAITKFSREMLAADPDRNVRHLRHRYPLDRGGHVIEGCRNPHDFQHLFDPRHDMVVVIHYPRNPVVATTFETDGVRLIDGIAAYCEATGQLAAERLFRFTISSVSGPARSCHANDGTGPIVKGTQHAWNMDEVTASVVHAGCLWRRSVDPDGSTAMGHVHCEIPPFAARLAEEYLYDLDPAKVGGWVDCTVFAVISYIGHAPTFQVMLVNGSVFSYLPAEALRHGLVAVGPTFTGAELVYHDCHSAPITVTRYATLAAVPARAYFKARAAWVGAQYVATVDWYEGNDLLHVLLLDNGQVAMLPSHKVLFGDDVTDTLPEYKKLRATFRVEDA